MSRPRSRPAKTNPSQPHPLAAQRSDEPTPSAAAQKATILLIDDDPAVLASLRRVLVAEGWHIITAKTGEEGLERLQEQEPDLMITDLRMANVNGWDLLFHENLERPELPIFVITALPPDATGGADEIATKFFQKPLDFDELLSAVRRQLDRKRAS